MDGVGQVPMNLLRGRFKSAGKKLVDVLGDIPDAVVPGDWIPHLADEEDQISGSEVLGIDKEKHPLFAGAADLGVGIAANPLSYLGVRGGKVKAGLPMTEGTEIAAATPVIDAVKDAAKKAYASVPAGGKKVVDATLKSSRRYLNYLDVPDESATAMKQATGQGAQSTAIHEARLQTIYEGMTARERDLAGQLLTGVRKVDAPLAPGAKKVNAKDRSAWTLTGDADDFLAKQPDITPERAARIKQSVNDHYGHGELLKEESVHNGSWKDVMGADGKPIQASKRYAHMRWTGDEESTLTKPIATLSSSSRKRVLETPKQRLDYLQEKPDVDLEFDPMVSGLARARQQGQQATKQALGKHFTKNDKFVLNDPDHHDAMTKAIADLGDTDEAYKLSNMWKGIPERDSHAFTQALHKGNKIFKAAATFGVVMPRLAFNVGNRMGGLWQAISNDAAKGTAGESSRRALQDMLGSVDDGLVKLFGGKKGRWEKSELTDDIAHWEGSIKAANGDTAKFRQLIMAHPKGAERGADLMAALDNDVINAGWVDQEALLSKMAATPLRQRFNDIMEWPASIAKGVEQRMRLGTFKDLRKQGTDPASAAKTVRDTYLDYETPGVENRRFRDVVPFGAFLSQNVKQQAGLLARHPVVGVAASQLYGSEDGNIRYPWMDNQMSVPAGLDENGNPQYITSLRLPFEGLAAVPGFDADDLYRDLGSPLQPLLKTAVSYATGKDTFTGGEFGQYDKILGEHMGETGRVYNNLKNTGVLQPFTAPVDQLTNLLDSRKSLSERAIQATTGVKMQSVDPDLAKKLELEKYLKDNPEVQQYTGYFQPKGENMDTGLSELLSQLNDAKEKLREKRRLAAVTP
jgi:hypothetical protein